MNRRQVSQLLGTGLALVALPGLARAQAGARRRLGALFLDRAESWQFLRRDLGLELARLGWIDGRNLSSDWRFAEGHAERLSDLALGLLRDGADAVLTRGTPATRALQRATTTIPIVTGVGDPVGSGFAATLAAPGGNITGLSYALVETVTKQLELLRELVPGLSRLHVLQDASRASVAPEQIAVVQQLASAQGLAPQVHNVAGIDGLRAALRAARATQGSERVGAFVFSFGATIEPAAVARAVLQAGIPAVFDQRGYVDVGGLLSYRLNWDDQTRHTAVQIDKVLRGADPARIPFELPTRSELVLNARTAQVLQLPIPTALRLRADDVVE